MDFPQIEAFLTTKTISSNGKLIYPSELSPEMTKDLINNPGRFEVIYGLLKQSKCSLVKRKIISCMKKFLNGFALIEGDEAILEFTKRVARGIKSGELHLGNCSLLVLPEADLRDVGFESDAEIKKLLNLLIRDLQYHRQFCELVSIFNLYPLINARSAILHLMKGKDADNLAMFLSKLEQHNQFLEIATNRSKEYLDPQNFKPSNPSMNEFSKFVKGTLKLMGRLDLLKSSEALSTVCTLPEVCWILQSAKKLESESDCNPNYDLREIQQSYLDKLPCIIESNKTLENLVKDLIKTYKLGFIFNNVDNLDLKIDSSNEYYNSKSPIQLVHSETPLILDPAQINLIGLDCEWTNESCLATTQLSIEFKNGGRSTLIIDMLSPPRNFGKTLAQLYNHNHWIGFDSKQDFKKINTIYPLLPPRPKNYTNVADHPTLKQMKLRGLSNVSQSILGLKLDKRPRMSNWNRRPLRRSQILYAAADCEVLLEIYAKLAKLVL